MEENKRRFRRSPSSYKAETYTVIFKDGTRAREVFACLEDIVRYSLETGTVKCVLGHDMTLAFPP